MKTRRIIAAGFAVLVLLLACSGIPVADPPTINENAQTATVMLVRGAKDFPYCGAVAIDVETLVTANHCVEDSAVGDLVATISYSGYLWGWTKTYSLVAAHDSINDVAILRTMTPNDAWGPMRFSALERGDKVCAVHHGGGRPYQFSCGEVLSPTYPLSLITDPVYRTNVPVFYGSSGAGIWDKYGRFCGTVVRFDNKTGHGIMMSVDPALELLRKEVSR